MDDIEGRLARLKGKLTHSAWTYVQELRHHAHFADILAHVESLEGALLETDVQQAVRRYLVQHPRTNNGR